MQHVPVDNGDAYKQAIIRGDEELGHLLIWYRTSKFPNPDAASMQTDTMKLSDQRDQGYPPAIMDEYLLLWVVARNPGLLKNPGLEL